MAACIGRVHNRVYLLLVHISQREEVNSLYMLTSELLTVHFPVEHCVYIVTGYKYPMVSLTKLAALFVTSCVVIPSLASASQS